jgi:tetratricopeptide (TPR) repeat protein
MILRRWLPAVLLTALAGSALVRADDIYVRGQEKPKKGTITAESAKEIKVGTKELIPAQEIVDIVYDMAKEEILKSKPYRDAVKAEKESLDPVKEAKRKDNLGEALKHYQEALTKLAGATHKRHVEYKIAMLKVRQALEDGAPAKDAITALASFTRKHKDGWQIASAYDALGRMQMGEGDYAGAEETYAKMAELATLPEETRMDARMLAVQAKVQAGKYGEARTELAELQRNLAKDSRFFARAKVAEAECLVAESTKLGKEDPKRAKLFDQAVEQVRGVIKDSNDSYVKAVGHNTLGYCYDQQGKAKDALWEFLWVDVVYNQDRVQHAKALFHLWDLFTKEGDAPRAQECRESLLAPEFAGLEYQKRVQKEAKTP